MRPVLLLARANLRQAKAQTAVMAVLLTLAALMLTVGLSVMTGYGAAFEATARELSTSDVYLMAPDQFYSDDAEHALAATPGVTGVERVPGLRLAVSMDGGVTLTAITVADADTPRTLSRWKTVGDARPLAADAAYVPYYYQAQEGYTLGDTVDLAMVGGERFAFTVAGFSEGIFQDQMYVGDLLFVPHDRFATLWDAYPDNRQVLLSVNGTADVPTLVKVLRTAAGVTGGTSGIEVNAVYSGTDLAAEKTSRTSMAGMIAAVLLLFAVVIAAVCLLVVRFHINNSIEEDMPRIGSLQAIGYTSRQIAGAVIVQYGLTALAAGTLGVLGAPLVLPLISAILARQSGLAWVPGFPVAVMGVSLGVIVAVVVLVSLAAAWKVRRIAPVLALRGGIATHSFKRNHAPLATSRLPLSAAWAWKSLAQGTRQAVTLGLIMVAVAFTAGVAGILYYNARVDITAFEKIPGIERANIGISFLPGQDAAALRDRVLTHDHVWKAQYVDTTGVTVDGTEATATIMADFAGRETVTVFEGRYPQYDNEIALSARLADRVGAGVGDQVRLSPGDVPYLVTGLTQGMAEGTYGASLTLAGERRIDPDFQQLSLMVYLDAGTDATVVVEELRVELRDEAVAVIDGDASFAKGVGQFTSILSQVGVAVLIIAALVVALVLYFIIASAIVRQHRRLGIQKAIGYTTANLMNQQSLGVLMPLALAAGVGCALAGVAFNPMLSLGFTSMGVVRSHLLVNPWWLAGIAAGIVIVGYITSLGVTRRIRRVSAYALVTE